MLNTNLLLTFFQNLIVVKDSNDMKYRQSRFSVHLLVNIKWSIRFYVDDINLALYHNDQIVIYLTLDAAAY